MSGLASALSSVFAGLSLSGSQPPNDPPPASETELFSTPADGALSTAPPTSSPPAPPEVPAGYVPACPLSSLPLHSRRCVSICERAVLLLRLPRSSSSSSSSSTPSSPPVPSNGVASDCSRVLAIDAICYHMGGPLVEGDIEELLGQPHIVCPWHHYRIGLETGEGAYQVAKGVWKSKGRRQRVHDVLVLHDHVHVRLSTEAGDRLESDVYGAVSITQEQLDAQAAKRSAGGGYRVKGPSGLNRGTLR